MLQQDGFSGGTAIAVCDDVPLTPPPPAGAGPPDVSVCIANWNCRDYLLGCLESLLRTPQGVRLEVIVVDNASADGAAGAAAAAFPEVRLVRNQSNLGFSRANNQAAQLARGRHLFFLNNDTVVPPGTLRRLVEYSDAHPEVGMVGPKLRGGDGALQISFRRKPTVAALLHRLVMLRWTGLFRRAYRGYRRAGFRADRVAPVEVLMGAAVMLPRGVFRSVGGWDEDYRFGGEDIDLSARVGRLGELVYLADVEVTHFGRVSSRENIEFAAPNVLIGYVHFFRKDGASPTAIRLYKTLLTVDAPLQLVGKAGQCLWRRLTGRREDASRSWLTCKGLWRFLTRDLIRFWRA